MSKEDDDVKYVRDNLFRALRIPDEFKEEKCLMEEAMKREMEKPPHLRQKGVLICCTCSRCQEKKGGRL